MTARWSPENGTDTTTADEHIERARAAFGVAASHLTEAGVPPEAIWAGAVAAALDAAPGEHQQQRLAQMLYHASLHAARNGGIEPATSKH